MTEEIRESYRLLELEAGSSLEAVKDAYRELIKVWHPDRFPRNDPKLQKRATEKTQALIEACHKITAYWAGNYSESRTSVRAAREEAERAEARQREGAARRAREASRLEEERRRAEEWAKQKHQKDEWSAQANPTPPPVSPNIPGESETQQPPRKTTRWEHYIGPALWIAFLWFLQPQYHREKAFDKTAFYFLVVFTVTALAVFGFVKGKFTGVSKVKSALRTVLVGGAAAGVTYALAKLIS